MILQDGESFLKSGEFAFGNCRIMACKAQGLHLRHLFGDSALGVGDMGIRFGQLFHFGFALGAHPSARAIVRRAWLVLPTFLTALSTAA